MEMAITTGTGIITTVIILIMDITIIGTVQAGIGGSTSIMKTPIGDTGAAAGAMDLGTGAAAAGVAAVMAGATGTAAEAMEATAAGMAEADTTINPSS